MRFGITAFTLLGVVRQFTDELLVAPLHLGARVAVRILVALEHEPGKRPDVGDGRLPGLRDARGSGGEVVGVLS